MNIRKGWFLLISLSNLLFAKAFGAATSPEFEIFKNQTLTESSKTFKDKFGAFNQEATELLSAGIFQTSSVHLLELMQTAAKIKLNAKEIMQLSYLTKIPLDPAGLRNEVIIQVSEAKTEVVSLSAQDLEYIKRTRNLAQNFYLQIYSNSMYQQEYESVLAGNIENHYNDFGFFVFDTCRDWLTQLNPSSSAEAFNLQEDELAEAITILCFYIKHFGDFR